VDGAGRGRQLAIAGLAVAVLGVSSGLQPTVSAQIVPPPPSPTDQMIMSRSQEQPYPSARNIPLPAGNPLQLLRVLGNVYLIAGGPSNVTVQIGSEGVLVVDSATPEVSDHVLQAIKVLSDKPIQYIINTTHDKTHYGGNERIGKAGENPTLAARDLAGRGAVADDGGGGGNNPNQLRPEGAIVFAHENLLNRMSAPTGETPAEPFAMWPSNTFFTPKKTFVYNDEAIELLHAPAAITDGDVMVFFRGSDVVVAGDVINTLAYPRFDPKKGGSIQGVLDALNKIIEITVPRYNQQAGTRVVAGHGRIYNEADVVEYRDMMTIIRDRVKLAVEKNMTLDQLKAQNPTLDYDGLYSTPGWTGTMLVEAIYAELRQGAAR
jgi:glyoxylase-like metal-dependent hydrolase (beta-lactamase superfamily II)